MKEFIHFGLSEDVMNAIHDLGFVSATPIQAKAIPSLLQERRDFIGLAHTGTGKTAAFAIPLIENTDTSKPYTQAVIIAPTRELVRQISEQLKAFATYRRQLKVTTVYGGVSISAQIKELRKPPHILIATPGRLIDLMDRKVVVLKDVNTCVLDEADEMLNMGFKEDIDKILSSFDESFKVWLFSATFPKEIRRISQTYMSDPLEFAVDSVRETNANIRHEYHIVKGSRKIETLKRLLDSDDELRGIVFCRTKRGTQSLADDLLNSDYKVDALHGDMSQDQRERVMKRFKNYQLRVLIATDVAARGIDVQDLTHIIHYDMPDDLAYYTHRSGRTGRAGKKGISIAFVAPSQQRKIKHFEKGLKLEFMKARIPGDNEIILLRINKWATGIAQCKELDRVDPEIHAEVYKILSNFTKEELIDKFTTTWLRNLKLSKMPKETVNEIETDRRDSGRGTQRSSHRERDKQRDKQKDKRKQPDRNQRREGKSDDGEMANFYINVGYMDGVGKRDLLTYLAEQTGIKMESFQNLDMNKKHAFFDAPKKIEGKLISSFRGVRIGNRKLRVNRNQN